MNKGIDFDLDDPLGDLLSDKSDDSFFENKNILSNKTSRNSSLDKKKSNIFGLGDGLTETKNDGAIKETLISTPKSDWLGIAESPLENSKLPADKIFSSTETTQKLSQGQKDSKTNFQVSIKPSFSGSDLNFLNDLGLSDIDTIAPVKNINSDLMDDILGPSKTNKKDNILTSKGEQTTLTGYNPTSGSNKPLLTRLATPGSKLDGDKVEQESKSNPLTIKPAIDIVSKPSRKETTGRRQRSTDWLGLFPDEEINDEPLKEKDVPLSELLKSQDVGLKHSKKEDIKEVEDSKKTEMKESQNFSNDLNMNLNAANLKGLLSSDMMLGVGTPIQLMNSADIEQQSAAICLQQQHSQLMVALQFKAQEESLAALHERQEESRRVQHEVVSAHREQLEQLLKGQAEHRTHLHNIMMQHQQRINQHIQALLKPLSVSDDKKASEPVVDEIDFKVNIGNDKEHEGGLRTKSERQQLENMILNLQENHSKELDILENSYRHQVHLINESLTSIEDRLKSENKNSSDYYLKRIEKLEQENMKLIEQGDERLRVLQEKIAVEREEIEKKHKRDIEILQEQNQAVISSVRETISLERVTLKDATDYSNKLDTIIKDVEKNNTICTSYMDKMDSIYKEDLTKREKALDTKEKQVAALLDSLEISKHILEKESQEMRVNLRNWEERLHKQLKALEEDKITVKMAKVELQNEKEMHVSEKEKFRMIIDSERETMKRNIDLMQEKYSEMEKELTEKMNKLDQDRLQLQVEKRHIENIQRDIEETQRKLESELNEVRENKKNMNNNQEKLHQSETMLAVRFQELETLTRSALAKHSVAERKISEANYAQQRYEEKMRELQEFAISLSAREQQVARDKVALSRERLTFHNMQKEFQCGLCKSSNIDTSIDLNKYATSQIYYKNINLNPDHLEFAVSRDGGVDNERMLRKDAVKRSNIIMNNIHDTPDMDITSKIFGTLASNKQYEKLSPMFQEIVDPKLVLLKLDVQSSTKNFKTDHLDQE